MQNIFMSRLASSRRAVQNWWLLLILGAAVFGTGIATFTYPGLSYVAMAIFFAVLIFGSGVVNIVLAASNTNAATGRGWLWAGGIVEVLLGLILMLYPAVSAATLPFFLACWLLLRSFALIGSGGDLMSMKVPGAGWTIVVGVVVLLCAVMILAQPILFGVEAVVIWVGVSFLMAGISMSFFSLQLRSLHRHFAQ